MTGLADERPDGIGPSAAQDVTLEAGYYYDVEAR